MSFNKCCNIENRGVEYDERFDRWTGNTPFKTSIVKIEDEITMLGPTEENPKPDYINACFIASPIDGIPKELIGTQCPTKVTLSSFWRMIFAFNVIGIGMLCDPDHEKVCFDYFDHKHYIDRVGKNDNFKIDIIGEPTFIDEPMNKVKKTVFEVTHEFGEKPYKKHVVEHLRYIKWPDRSVPQTVEEQDSLAKMVWRLVELNAEKGIDGPITTHCYLGLGRSGTT